MVDEAINNPAGRKEASDTRSSRIAALKKEYDREELALFVGAGISKDAGILQWKDLINALLSKMIVRRMKGNKTFSRHLEAVIRLAHQNQENSPIAQIRYIRGRFPPMNTTGWCTRRYTKTAPGPTPSC